MGNKKINQLPSATSVGTGDVTVIYQNGVTKQIPVSQIGGGGSGGGGLVIPKPELRIGQFSSAGTQELSVYYNHIESNDWLSHNPQLWIYRYVNRRHKKIGPGLHKKVPAKWSHPTTSTVTNNIVNDLGQRMYAGATDVPLTTEWVIPSDWKCNSMLQGFVFDALPYWRHNGQPISFNSWPVNISANQIHTDKINPTSQVHRHNSISCWFKFRFVIEDPNNANRVLLGPESDLIKSYPNYVSSTDLWYGIGLRFRKI